MSTGGGSSQPGGHTYKAREYSQLDSNKDKRGPRYYDTEWVQYNEEAGRINYFPPAPPPCKPRSTEEVAHDVLARGKGEDTGKGEDKEKRKDEASGEGSNSKKKNEK